jgi:hypothetical protein
LKSTLAVTAFGFLIGFASLATAQTPPVEPADFSVSFTASAEEGTLLPLLEQSSEVGPRRPGSEKGAIYEDFTHRRVRTDFIEPDGTPELSVYQFFDKNVQYTYDPNTQSCSKSALTGTLVPFFGFLASAKLVFVQQAGVIAIDTWRYTAPKGSDVKLIDLSIANNAQSTPLSISWRAPFPVQMTFDTFQSGQPDAVIFNLPASCVI